MPTDSLTNIIIAPPLQSADTLCTDLDHALASSYSTAGIDLDALQVVVPPPPSTWEDGIEGIPRQTNAGDDSGVLAIITGMFVLMLLSYKHCRRLFSTLINELLGMRQRSNVFDEHTTNETEMLVLMALQWCVYTGLLLYSHFYDMVGLSAMHTFRDTVMLIALMGGYYVFQLSAYATVGYTFATPEGCRHFVQGFTSSQSLLGFLLIVPALVAIFYPAASSTMIIISLCLYFLARIIFIVKGFRIFYQKISSLLYFILYLCTLEIIPLIVLYHLALFLVNSH